MNCPKCREPEMDSETSHEVRYERCPRCDGMFYEQLVLQRVLAQGLGTRDSLAFSVQSDQMDTIPAHCFRCQLDMTPVMMNGIRIDECSKCKGVFLDQGEVASLIFAR